MMKLAYIFVYFIGLIGCWYILSCFIVVPSKKYRKIVKAYTSGDASKTDSGSTDSIEMMIETFSKKIIKYIHLNDIKRSEMVKALSITNNSKTPEEFVAHNLTMSAIFLPIGLFFMIFNQTIGFCGIGLSAVIYIYNSKKLNSAKKAAISDFDKELPRYVAYLKQSFKTNPNVMSVMEGYITDNAVFTREMNHALADAKTSNFTSAMARLDQRISSDHMKMVVHGLRSAFNGEDVKNYFAMLETDFTQYEVATLKKAIKTIPQKMQLPKLLIFTSVLGTLATPLVMQIVSSFKDIFGSM